MERKREMKKERERAREVGRERERIFYLMIYITYFQ